MDKLCILFYHLILILAIYKDNSNSGIAFIYLELPYFCSTSKNFYIIVKETPENKKDRKYLRNVLKEYVLIVENSSKEEKTPIPPDNNDPIINLISIDFTSLKSLFILNLIIISYIKYNIQNIHTIYAI